MYTNFSLFGTPSPVVVLFRTESCCRLIRFKHSSREEFIEIQSVCLEELFGRWSAISLPPLPNFRMGEIMQFTEKPVIMRFYIVLSDRSVRKHQVSYPTKNETSGKYRNKPHVFHGCL